jgi:uncharacterized membrane protein YphA (DoxX/SURF4 family)
MLEKSRSSTRSIEWWLSTACRFALAGIWLWAGIAKILEPDEAVRAVAAYRLMPHVLVKPMAWGLPFAEVALAVVLLLGIRTRVAAILSLALLVLFVAAVLSAWLRGLQIECGCFGGGGPSDTAGWRSYLWEIGRDLGFAAPAAWLIARPRSRFAMEGA